MVFNLTSKKKKSSKRPTGDTAQPRIHAQPDATNVMLQPVPPQHQAEQLQDFPEDSVYRKLSSSRAIFESHKLQSACSFLKYLKEKLEKDVVEKNEDSVVRKDSLKATETITCILDTLIDVSDSITPIVSDVSYCTASDESSTISERHFNKTMVATGKLLELSKRTGRPLNVADVTSYFAQTIVANNLEELSMFKDSIKTVGDKIYVDKKLLEQLIELHSLLKDTIDKLKTEELKFLSDPEVRYAIELAPSAEIAATPVESSFEPPAASTPKRNKSPSPNRSKKTKIPKKSPSKSPPPMSPTALFADETTAYETALSSQTKAGEPSAESNYASALSANNTAYETALSSQTKAGEPSAESNYASALPANNTAYETALSSQTNALEPSAAPLTPKRSDSSILTADKMKKKKIKRSKKELKSAKVLSVEKVPSLAQDSTMDSSIKIREPLIPTVEVSSHIPPEFATGIKEEPSSFHSYLQQPVIKTEPRSLESMSYGAVKGEKSPTGSQVKFESSSYVQKPEPLTPSQVKFDRPPDKESMDKSIGVPSSGFLYPSTPKVPPKQVVDSCCGAKPQVGNESTMTQSMQSESRGTSMFRDTTKSTTVGNQSAMTQSMQSESRGTSMFGDTTKSTAAGTASILKQTSNTDKDMTTDDNASRKSQQTQTLLTQLAATIDRKYPNKPPPTGKIKCKECTLRRELANKLKEDRDHTLPTGTTSFSSRRSNVSASVSGKYTSAETTKADEKSTTFNTSMLNKKSPYYFEGVSKCIAELDCMSNCLKHAKGSGQNIHSCIAIVPETDQFISDTGLPHFHTVVDGVPIVIQFTKRAIPIDNSVRDASVGCCRKSCAVATFTDASTCCRDKNPEGKQFLPCKLWGTLSKTVHEKRAKHRGSFSKTENRRERSPKNSPCSKSKRPTTANVNSSPKGDGRVPAKLLPLKNKLPCFAPKEPKPQKYCGKDRPCTPLTNVLMAMIEATPATESSPSIPYVAAKSSLPRVKDPNKNCSSMQFDVDKMTTRTNELDHPDGNVKRILQEFTVEQLLDSFRPAKCCRKAVLNEKQRGTLPYAASLRSLPLQEGDLQTIHNTITQSKKRTNRQTLFEYCVHFQNGIDRKIDYRPAVVVFEVRFFELFKKESDGKPARRQQQPPQNNPPNPSNPSDMKIFDFLRKIYTADPIYDKVSKTNNRPKGGDCDGHTSKSDIPPKEKERIRETPKERRCEKREKHSSSSKHHHKSKYKKTTETKSYYTSIESYSAVSKSNQVYLDSSVDSVASNNYASRSRISSDSTMYSFLLIPNSELNIEPSCNDLSTSYAPSVNSLPFEDDALPSTSNHTTQSTLPFSRPSSDEDEPLSPRNYAMTLDGIYELDENGNMRPKGSLSSTKSEEIPTRNNIPGDSYFNLPANARNLSTIYESDEKSTNKDSSSILNYPSSKSFNIVRSRSVSPDNSAVTIRISSDRSRIPVSIHSYSASTLCKDKSPRVNRPSQTQNVSFRCPLYADRGVNSAPASAANSRIELRPRASSTPSRKINSTNIAHSKSYDKEDYWEAKDDSASAESLKTRRVRSKVRQSDSSTKPKRLQRSPNRSDNLESLPITFEIIPPQKERSRNVKVDNNVMSFDIESANTIAGGRGKELQCYRSQNLCAWPRIQKRHEAPNKAFIVSVHASHGDVRADRPSQVRVVQQYPTKTTISQTSHKNDKQRRLTVENFVIGTIGNELHETKSAPNRPTTPSAVRTKASKHKKKVRHIRPEVIDIKVPKDVKSTKLKHRFMKNGDRPGYVTILSPPCNCPDITIFLPCFCGPNEHCDVFKSCLSRDAQQYSMIPIAEKSSKASK